MLATSCRRLAAFVTLTGALVLLPGTLQAHDMPSDVLVQTFVKSSGTELQLLVRVPLISLLNINLPKRGEEYLDLAFIEPALQDAAHATVDRIDLYADGHKLGAHLVSEVRISLPSDKSFESYEAALAHVRGPRLPVDTQVVWNQGFFDALLVYQIASEKVGLAIQPYFGSLAPRVITTVRFIPPNGSVRAFELIGNPGLVHLDPRWHQAALTFVKAGFVHILSGMDHLLFLLCLVIPLRRVRSLVPVVTAFTAAHSVTLIASAYQIAPTGAWFQPVIETLIAVSIVYMALDNIFRAEVRHRWVIAFGFGLVHGFGFSFALRQTLQFAGAHLLTSLLSFNVGVEVGQVCVLTIFVGALVPFFRFVNERTAVIVLSALVCHTGWHWMVDRATMLTTIAWLPSDLVEMGRWVMGAAIAASAAVLAVGFARRLLELNRATSPSLDRPANERA